nr:pyridoxamine 5'-phosphate oxidase family protein [uncultured Desulfobacter sp.]
MKSNKLTTDQITALLTDAQVGHLATISSNGFPYVTPVHFVYTEKKIFIHGLSKGQKIENIQRNSKVCFEVMSPGKFLLSDEPCDVNTEYKSVIIHGEASILSEKEKKIEALDAIVGKYVPNLAGKEFPSNMLKATGVIKIEIKECTGKFYDASCQ